MIANVRRLLLRSIGRTSSMPMTMMISIAMTMTMRTTMIVVMMLMLTSMNARRRRSTVTTFITAFGACTTFMESRSLITFSTTRGKKKCAGKKETKKSTDVLVYV